MIFDLKEQILKILFGENTIYYINGPQKLPPPLSREEEEQIFSLLTVTVCPSGDSEKDSTSLYRKPTR